MPANAPMEPPNMASISKVSSEILHLPCLAFHLSMPYVKNVMTLMMINMIIISFTIFYLSFYSMNKHCKVTKIPMKSQVLVLFLCIFIINTVRKQPSSNLESLDGCSFVKLKVIPGFGQRAPSP